MRTIHNTYHHQLAIVQLTWYLIIKDVSWFSWKPFDSILFAQSIQMHLIVELLNVSKNSFFKLLATFPSICASNIKFLIHHLYCIRFLSFRVSTFSTSNPSQDVVLTDAVDNNHKQTKKVLENVLYALFMTF